jgi:hypothetical protein
MRRADTPHPKLMSRAPMTLLKSATSRALVAMIGEAPTARVALAESLMTTLFVIYNCKHSSTYIMVGSFRSPGVPAACAF